MQSVTTITQCCHLLPVFWVDLGRDEKCVKLFTTITRRWDWKTAGVIF